MLPEMKKKIWIFQTLLVFRAIFENAVFWGNGHGKHQTGVMPIHYTLFLVNVNEEALLKISFKNIDWFQICPFSKTTAFSKKALKTNKFWKIQFFFHFWWQFYRAFQWYIVCFHTFSGCWYTEGNVNVKSHLHTTVRL